MSTPREELRLGIMNTTSARFEFDLKGLSSKQLDGIFDKGLPESYAVGRDRIIQEYLRAHNYKVVVFVRIVFNPGATVEVYRFIYFCHEDEEDTTAQRVRRSGRFQVPYGGYGYAVVHVSDIHYYVLGALRLIKKTANDLLSLKEAADDVWSQLSRKRRVALIQSWISVKPGKQANPVFWPIKPARGQGDREGSRLDLADLTTVGLIYGMLRHEVRFSDFAAVGT